MHAPDRAMWRARFLGEVFSFDVGKRIFLEWNARVTPLLGTIVNQPVFANVEIPRAGAASPIVWFPAR